jgi:hypothetical protein
MKKVRGDKPIGVLIPIYKEISQGNTLCGYLYLKQKCHFFLLQNWKGGSGEKG